MKRKYIGILLVILVVFVISACRNRADSGEQNTLAALSPQAENADETPEETTKKETEGAQAKMQEMIIKAGGQSFQAALSDNETVQALLDILPMTLSMDELHGNEKFYYLEEGLPTDSENVGTIQTGDIMLFGSDCLVLFFEDFSTSYSYTRIGHIEDSEAFANALKSGTVEVTFEAGE